MKKIFILALLLTTVRHGSSAQCNINNFSAPVAKFTGPAPAPWAINGQINDWTTILGDPTGNPALPFGSSQFINNKSFEPVELDTPDPNADIRFLGYSYDSYNVYFYLRRMDKGGQPISYYYFCDINMDGHMAAGEPVFGGRWGGPSILDIYSFVPNTTIDHESAKGNRMYAFPSYMVNGYTIKGGVSKLFNSNTIPTASSLLPNEVFKTEVTENGYGLEFAIPWRYLKNWVTGGTPLIAGNAFSYHVASQYGPVQPSTTYDPSKVADNIGSCCQKLAYVEVAKTNVVSATQVQPQKFSVTLSNPMNQPQVMGIGNIFLSDFDLEPDLPFNMSDIVVKVNGIDYLYDVTPGDFIDPQGPSVGTLLNPGATANYTIEVIFPANGATWQARVTILPKAPLFTPHSILYCLPSGLGGPPGNPPIIFDVTTGERNRFLQPGTENTNATSLRLFPNPGKGTVNVVLPVPQGVLRIEDMSGKILRQEWMGTKVRTQINDLRAGFYLVRYIDPEGQSWVTKLIIQ